MSKLSSVLLMSAGLSRFEEAGSVVAGPNCHLRYIFVYLRARRCNLVVPVASLLLRPEGGGTTALRNLGDCLPVNTTA